MGITFHPNLESSQNAIDPRFTFARQHVDRICVRTDLVLAVSDIWKALRDKPHSTTQRALLEEFLGYRREFYPDQQAYVPIRVFEIDKTEERRSSRSSSKDGTDLTQILKQLDEERDLTGVLLSARSGAGKTLASFKSLFDCFTATPGQSEPRLAGRLPIWLNTDGVASSDSDPLSLSRLVGMRWPRTGGSPCPQLPRPRLSLDEARWLVGEKQ